MATPESQDTPDSQEVREADSSLLLAVEQIAQAREKQGADDDDGGGSGKSDYSA